MAAPIVNGFRLVGTYKRRPPYLTEYKILLGYQVYISSLKGIFVVFDHENNIYYAFEHDGYYKDIDKGLRANVRLYIIKL